jgi:hypothetical protein
MVYHLKFENWKWPCFSICKNKKGSFEIDNQVKKGRNSSSKFVPQNDTSKRTDNKKEAPKIAAKTPNEFVANNGDNAIAVKATAVVRDVINMLLQDIEYASFRRCANDGYGENAVKRHAS